jgi:hypothetical protein
MAIAEQTLYNSYTPNGVTTVFAYGFALFRESDLLVELDGVAVSSGFSVSGVGGTSGGSVTFTTAPTGTTLVIKLDPAMNRTTDYSTNGDLLAATINDDLDRLWSAIQYLKAEYNVAIKLPFETATAQEITEDAADRAGNLVGFDGSGNVALLAVTDANLTSATAFGLSLLDDANAAAGRTTLATPGAAQTQEGVRFTATGTAPAYVLTPSPAIVAYAEGQRFTVEAHSDGTIGSNTLNVSGLGAKSLKQYDDAGNKRSGVVKNGQIAVVEYDGTDFVILNPLPVFPVTSVRQTVQSGPTSSGLPDMLPATAVGLSITSNSFASTPLVVSAAQGFGHGSDRIGTNSSTLTWSGLADNTTNYLYVTVNSDGTLTTGSINLVSHVAPVFTYTATASTNSGTHTFDITKMTMYVGNGSAAPAAWRVFIGEAVTSGGAVTATYEYAYNGLHYTSGNSFSSGGSNTINHNIGAPNKTTLVLVDTDASGDAGYVQNQEIQIGHSSYYWATLATDASNPRRATKIQWTNTSMYAHLVPGGTPTGITIAEWRYNAITKRDF